MRTNKPKRNEWIKYNIYSEMESVVAMAAAIIDDKNNISVKLLFKAPHGMYYSFLEDAQIEAERIFSKYYKLVNIH